MPMTCRSLNPATGRPLSAPLHPGCTAETGARGLATWKNIQVNLCPFPALSLRFSLCQSLLLFRSPNFSLSVSLSLSPSLMISFCLSVSLSPFLSLSLSLSLSLFLSPSLSLFLSLFLYLLALSMGMMCPFLVHRRVLGQCTER